MYIIKFKGSFDDIEISEEQGKKIIDLMKTKNLPERIELNGGIYDSKSIKAVQPSGNSRASTNSEASQKYRQEIEKDYQNHRERVLAKTPEERGEDLNILTLVWYAQTGENLTPEEIPQDVAKKVKKLQVDFFKENPKRMYATPTIYRHILPTKAVSGGDKEYRTLARESRARSMDIVERLIATDMAESRK